MLFVALGRIVVLLLVCVELTLAITDQQAANNQIHGEDLYADVYIHEDSDSLENLMGCGTVLRLQRVDVSNRLEMTT